jgi:hypothetical protein
MKSNLSIAVAGLNADLFDRIASFPRARTELADFHFKHAVEDYIAAITAFGDEKLLVSAPNTVEATNAIRRAVLLSDLIVLRVASHLGPPAICLLPIGDDVASPVLGASAAIDPATGEQRFATPEEYMIGMGAMAIAQPESSSTVDLLGRPFNSPDEPSWHRTIYSRTSQEFVNARGEMCHIAAGAIHLQIPKDDRLLDEAESLLRKGRLAYTPFLSLPASSNDVTEGALKAELLKGHLGVFGGPVRTAAASNLVLELEVPYLEDVPLDTLSEILDDEGESLLAFRRELRRVIEDIDCAKDSADVKKRVTKLKRDVLEDELQKVQRTLDRVARMNSVTRTGAYVGVGSLTIAGFFGLSAATAITGGAGLAAATLISLWRNYEDTRDVRRSPMHLVWQIGRRVRARG